MFENITLNDGSKFVISSLKDIADIVREKLGSELAEIILRKKEEYDNWMKEKIELLEEVNNVKRE